MPASVCILTKMLRNEWTGMISSSVILRAWRGSARAREVLIGCALASAIIARSLAERPPMPRLAICIQ